MARQCQNGTGLGISDRAQSVAQWAPPLALRRKVLGGSSSINAMIWSRGHKNDWEYFAEAAGDPRWRYESVLGLYRRLEDWQGTPDPQRRGGWPRPCGTGPR